MNLFASIPHSGLKIPAPAHWLKALPFDVLMCDPDLYVDELYEPALKKYQIPFFVFEWHRYGVDANRFPFNISEQTVEKANELIKTHYQREPASSPSDIHWHKTTLGYLLIKKALTESTHRLLIEKYLNPFHKKIKTHIQNLKQQGEQKIYLLDLHSMPSQATAFHKDTGRLRTEVVIGDNEGKSCSPAFRDLVISAYKKAGFQVALNDPYQGGAIIKQYGKQSISLQKANGITSKETQNQDPFQDDEEAEAEWTFKETQNHLQEALQIELNRKLYMNEVTKEKNKHFSKIQKQLQVAFDHIVNNLSFLWKN